MTRVGLAATAGTSAAAAGLAAIAATGLGVRMVQGAGPAPADSSVTTVGLPFYLLVFGTMGGIALAAVVAWVLLAPLRSTYHRGGLALVSAFVTVMLMLVCIPVEQLFGRPGLAALSGLCFVLSFWLAQRARRGASSMTA